MMSTEVLLIPVSVNPENELDSLEGWASSAASVIASLTQQWQLAQAKMREEQIRQEVWQDYFKQQQDELEQSRRFRTTLRTDLRSLHLAPIITPRPMRGKTLEELWPNQLNELLKLFEQLLNRSMDETDLSLLRLQQEAQYFIKQLDSATPPAAEEMKVFFETVQITVNAYLENMEEQETYQKQILKQTERLLENLMTYQQLTDNPAQIQNLIALQQNILEPGAITADILALFEEQMLLLKTSIDESLQNAAIQTRLTQTLKQRLTQMGYRLVDEMTEFQTVWRIPGGEVMMMLLQNRYQIAFQMRHERDNYREESLTDEELAFFIKQQSRWRIDMERLLHLLEKDGFNYRLQFEPESKHTPITVTE